MVLVTVSVQYGRNALPPSVFDGKEFVFSLILVTEVCVTVRLIKCSKALFSYSFTHEQD